MIPADITERLKLHIEYSALRDKFAKLAIELLAQGNDERGMEAAEKAELWDIKARSLE